MSIDANGDGVEHSLRKVCPLSEGKGGTVGVNVEDVLDHAAVGNTADMDASNTPPITALDFHLWGVNLRARMKSRCIALAIAPAYQSFMNGPK